jgi:hypothetical protein
MQTLDIDQCEMPDLQFVMLVTALCTSRLPSLNVPLPVRVMVFDRCWALIHEGPPPRRLEERVLDLGPWTELTVEAMVETIRVVLKDFGIHTLTWDEAPSESTHTSTPKAQPLIERFDQLYPRPSEASEDEFGGRGRS